MRAAPSPRTAQQALTPALRPSTLRMALVPLTLTVTLALGGCATSASPGWDARFGDSLRILQAEQLIAPDAPMRHGQTVPPSDGRSVSEAMQRLNESYRSPPPPIAIQIGGGGSSASR
ncbi:MAG: hypothetical protein WCT47_15255 [Betaproteobacteria bacterium]|jgi:hypothetical protein